MITPVLLLDSREQWRPCAIETIHQVGATINGYPVDLAQLPAAGGRIDFPPDMTQPDAPAAGYHRVQQGGGLWWHQFWTWWLYNPKEYAGIGAHEGDWELVQLGCADSEGAIPILATFSQHDGGEKAEYWTLELDGDSPLVYVARDSHANYPGELRNATDQADGCGERLEPTWLELGSWAGWPGTWGNSRNSPGPLAVRRAWTEPHAWHSQARG